ncbi:ankyrin repeat-containing domain protein [Baffinella frigidus]|nr:ankyrin repeat-containing domain protein [Cryptophyta sp. CCMP2293]
MSLRQAALDGNVEKVRRLLIYGANIDEEDNLGDTGIYCAAANGDLRMVKFLVEQGADKNSPTKQGQTAMFIAAWNGNLPVVKFLVEQGANMNDSQKKGWINSDHRCVRATGYTPLIIAAFDGQEEVVRFLVGAGADITATSKDGHTALSVARGGAVALLRDARQAASPDSTWQRKGIFTPSCKHCDAKKDTHWLVVAGGSRYCYPRPAETPAQASTAPGAPRASPAATTPAPPPPLPAAQRAAAAQAAADKTVADERAVAERKVGEEKGGAAMSLLEAGEMALASAAWDGELEEVRRLLQAGANIDGKDSVGCTPLYRAAQQSHLAVVNLLLGAGADKNARETEYGNTPLWVAAAGGHLAVLRALVDAGADKDAPTANGRTPLLMAAWNGHVEVVRTLVEAGADVTAQSKDGRTALDVADGEAVKKLLRDAR